jgi:hypothetical protein
MLAALIAVLPLSATAQDIDTNKLDVLVADELERS